MRGASIFAIIDFKVSISMLHSMKGILVPTLLR